MKTYIAWIRDDSAQDISSLHTYLSAHDAERLQQLKIDSAKRELLISRALLAQVLCNVTRSTHLQFSRAESGRLVLEHPHGWHISLSHSYPHIAVIVAQAPCGIDIETLRKAPYQAIAQRYFSPEENTYLLTLPDSEKAHAFFQLWTLKEAAIKAYGVGIAHHLAAFAFDISAKNPQQIKGSALQLWQHEESGIYISAAVQGEAIIEWHSTLWTINDLNHSAFYAENI